MLTKAYIINMPQNKSVICSGITFENFISSLSMSVDNIMIITCSNGLLFSECEIKHGFELLNKLLLDKLKDEDISGDFAFIDYSDVELLNRLSKYEIAELLYMGHTFEPLNENVIYSVDNRFIYLSHDNGFYSKIYYTEFCDYVDIVGFVGAVNDLLNNTHQVKATKNLMGRLVYKNEIWSLIFPD